jgi:maleate isomerase
MIDDTLPDGPTLQTGVGVVASFDFVRDRELWRWVPGDVSVFMSRTAPVATDDNVAMIAALNDPGLLDRPTREVCAVGAEAVLYSCTACSFIGGPERERELRAAMSAAGAPRAVTTVGAAVRAIRAVGARRVAVVHPYIPAIGAKLVNFLTESGLDVVAARGLGLTPEQIYRLAYHEVAELAERGDHPDAEALFVSCTALPTYDLIAPLERRLGKPVLTANQAGMWALLDELGLVGVGPGQTLMGARS